MKKNALIMFTTFLLIVAFNIPTQAVGWGFKKNSQHTAPSIGSYQEMIEGTNSFYIGEGKKVYLTFDAGYDNGNLESILDVLNDKGVKATFFVTGDFIERFSLLTKRLVEDGHIVANHSYSHKTITSLTKEELANDLNKLEDSFQKITNQEMVKIFRPPRGEFDRQSLLTLKEFGYKTVFWSIAYQDWAEEHQRGAEYSYNSVITNLHDGAIILMHSVSTSNRDALPKVIDEIRRQGYEFADVTEL